MSAPLDSYSSSDQNETKETLHLPLISLNETKLSQHQLETRCTRQCAQQKCGQGFSSLPKNIIQYSHLIIWNYMDMRLETEWPQLLLC